MGKGRFGSIGKTYSLLFSDAGLSRVKSMAELKPADLTEVNLPAPFTSISISGPITLVEF